MLVPLRVEPESELELVAIVNETRLSSLLATDGIVSAVNVSTLVVPSPAASLSALNCAEAC